MKVNNLIKLKKLIIHKSFVKYIFVGLIYTFATPIIFIFLSKFVSRILAVVIFYPIGYLLKYFIYKKWVFNTNSVNLKKFLMHVMPIFLISLFFTHITNFINEIYYVAILLVIISGVSGYFWGRLIYKKNNF